MNSARLCIREMRRFERFHIGGRRRYISSLGTHFAADTSLWGNASFLCSSESQEFDVVILLSWVPEFLFSWRDVRIKVTRYCRRLTSAFRPALGTLPPSFSYFTRLKSSYFSVSDIPLSCLNVIRRFFGFTTREVSKVLWFFNLVRNFLL